MQVLLLLLIVVGITAQDDTTGNTPSDEKCISELKSDFLLQVTANATTQVLVTRMEEFNSGLAITSNVFDEINNIVLRELKDGTSITGIIERVHIWCLITKPTDTSPTVIPVAEENELEDDEEEESIEKETKPEVENGDMIEEEGKEEGGEEEGGEEEGGEEEGGEEEGGEEEGGEEEGGEEEVVEGERSVIKMEIINSGDKTEVRNTENKEREEEKQPELEKSGEEKPEDRKPEDRVEGKDKEPEKQKCGEQQTGVENTQDYAKDEPKIEVEEQVEEEKVEEKEPVMVNNGINNTEIKNEDAQGEWKKQGVETRKDPSDQPDLSYLCLIENNEEKCYLYIYSASGKITLHEHGIPNYS